MKDVVEVKIWLQEKYGISVTDDQMRFLEKAIDNIRNEYPQLENERLISHLKDRKSQILSSIVDAVTVQESYFFRDQSLFNYLRGVVLPGIIKEKIKKNNTSIKIWSAGCARGEELYTVAILLSELLDKQDNWNISLTGTDINDDAIEYARRGLYKGLSFRSTEDEIKEKFFKKIDSKWLVNPEIKKLCHFSLHNLCDDVYPDACFDIIICRNVFIYFTSDAIRYCMEKFKKSLGDNSYLFLGVSDFVTYIQHDLEFHIDEGVTYFTKKIDKVEIIKESDAKKISPYIEIQKTKSQAVRQIKLLYNGCQYKELLKKIDEYSNNYSESLFSIEYKVKALVGMNDLETALFLCEKGIGMSPKCSELFYYKGMIEMSLGCLKESENSLRKSIRYNEVFPEGNFQLGMLLIRKDNIDDGLERLKVALKYAKQSVVASQVFDHPEVSYKDYAESIESTIKFYKDR